MESHNDNNGAALPNPASTPSKVFEQLVEAKNIHSQNTTSMELAPPSAPSPSSNKSPANNYNNSSNGALSSSSSVAAAQQQSTLPLSPNGKLFSHVERAENNNNNNNNNPLPSIMKKEQQQSPTPPPSAMMQDTVERIVNAVENREASSRESALANGYSQQQQQQIMEVTHGGQFTSTELSQLSILCTSGFSTVTNNNSNNNNNNGGMKQQSYYQSSQWASIDGDLLSSLTPMLRAHVTSAMRVDLIGEGVGVITNTIKAESSPEKKTGPVITIHQVRMGGQIYWKLQCRILFQQSLNHFHTLTHLYVNLLFYFSG